MKYTIAIPTYNSAHLLEKALDSCINQQVTSNVEHEILIVNNASTDNTLEVIEKYESTKNLRVINNEETVTQFENHNVCFREAKGDYILFCHSDDSLFSDALDKLETILSSHNNPKNIVCFGRSFFRDFEFNYNYVATINTFVSGDSGIKMLIGGGLTPSGTCYSKTFYSNFGGFLPMRTNITPCDLTSLISYVLKGGEILMFDRLIVNRLTATTATFMTQDIILNSHIDAFEELFAAISEEEVKYLCSNSLSLEVIDLQYIYVLIKLRPQYFSTNNKLNLKIRYIMRNKKVTLLSLLLIKKHFIKLLFS